MPTDRNTAVPDSKLLEKDDKKKDKFCQTAVKSAWFFWKAFMYCTVNREGSI